MSFPRPEDLPRWADGASAAVQEPSEGKKDLGWVAEKPPHEVENWLQLKNYQWLAYLASLIDPVGGRLTGVTDGKKKASGFPDFIQPGFGPNAYATLEASALVPFWYIKDGVYEKLESNIQSPTLTLAPAANNTATVSDAVLAQQIATDLNFSAHLGEYGGDFYINPVGSEISSAGNNPHAYLSTNGNEVFIATMQFALQNMRPITRGISATVKSVITNGGTITLLRANWLFLNTATMAIDATTFAPSYGPAVQWTFGTGAYWFDSSIGKWKKYNGATWDITDNVYLGCAVCDTSGCQWAEHEDFMLNWRDDYHIQRISIQDGTNAAFHGPMRVAVKDKLLEFDLEKVNVTYTALPLISGGPNTQMGYYIYMDEDGTMYRSTDGPRRRRNVKGLYHPNEYYRCIAWLPITGAGSPTIFNFDPMAGIMEVTNAALDLPLTTSWADLIIQGGCEFAQGAKLSIDVDAAAAYSVELSNPVFGGAGLTVMRGVAEQVENLDYNGVYCNLVRMKYTGTVITAVVRVLGYYMNFKGA
jgi:hypothetical protein